MAQDLSIEIGANTKELTAGLKQAENQLRSFATTAARSTAVAGGATAKATKDFTALNRVIQDAPFGLMGVANNLQMLIPNIGALSIGINLALTAVQFAQIGFGAWTRGLIDNKKAVDASKESGDDYIKTLGGVAAAQLMGAQNAASEIAVLKILYAQTQNVNLSQKQRLSAVNQLQSEYPAYFKNIKDEAILAGKAVGKYNELTQAIIASGRARAAVDLIAKNQTRKLEDEQKILDLQKEQVKNEQSLSILKARSDSAQGSAGVGAAGGIGIAREMSVIEGKIATNKEAQRNLATDIYKLDEKSLQLIKSVNKEVEKGATLTGSVGATSGISKVKTTPNFRDDQFKGRGMEDVSGRVQVGLDGLVEQYRKTEAQLGKISLIPPIEPIKTGLSYINAELVNFNEQASNIVNGGIVNTFAGIGEAIGQSLSTGASLASTLGSSLLGALGAVLGQLGQMAIATGVAILGIKTALKTLNPVAAIGAGVALLALSGVVKGAASRLGGSMGSGGGGGDTGSSIPPSSAIPSGSSVNNFNGGRVVFEIAGQKLIGVLANTQAANLRFGP